MVCASRRSSAIAQGLYLGTRSGIEHQRIHVVNALLFKQGDAGSRPILQYLQADGNTRGFSPMEHPESALSKIFRFNGYRRKDSLKVARDCRRWSAAIVFPAARAWQGRADSRRGMRAMVRDCRTYLSKEERLEKSGRDMENMTDLKTRSIRKRILPTDLPDLIWHAGKPLPITARRRGRAGISILKGEYKDAGTHNSSILAFFARASFRLSWRLLKLRILAVRRPEAREIYKHVPLPNSSHPERDITYLESLMLPVYPML